MIFDYGILFADKQAMTATTDGQFIVDLGPGDTGRAEKLSLVAVTPASTGTMQVKLNTSDTLNAAKSALASPDTVATYDVAAERIERGGTVFASRLPHGMKRYAAVSIVVTGALIGEPVTCGLVTDVQSNG